MTRLIINNLKIFKLLIVLTLFSFSNLSFAITNTANSSGPWETASNWSQGHVPLSTEDVVISSNYNLTINSAAVCLSLNITPNAQLTISASYSLTVSGNLQNNGTFTAGANTTLTFNGANNSTVGGTGTFTINYIVLNMSTKTTVLDIQSNNFIAGINSAAGYNFTFTSGTFKYNNTASLNDCHDNNSATTLTIPFNVIIESDKGTLDLCPNGSNSGVVLSGKLFMNGGTVYVQEGQAYNAAFDFVYKVNGGTPQLYVTSGSLSIGGGFHSNSGSDYIDFNMTGGNVTIANRGMSVSYSFQLANVTGGSTVMSGGTIMIQDACNVNLPDIDMGGANVSPYSVTGGTVQFGNLLTQGGATYFGVQPNGAHNYPNLDFEGGIAKSVSPWVAGDFSVISIFICPAMTFDISGYNPNVTFIGTNGTFALNNSGTFNMGSGSFIFQCPSILQLVTGTSTNVFGNVVVDNPKGVTFQIPSTITGTLYLTNGNLLIMSNSIIFEDGNTPIVRTNGTMSYNATANLIFGMPGHTGGAAFTIPSGTFLTGLPLDTLAINRANNLKMSSGLIISGTLILTSGSLDMSDLSLTFQDGNIPISRVSGNIITSINTTLAFGSAGHTAGNPFTIPSGTFAGSPSFRTFTLSRSKDLTLSQSIIINGSLIMAGGILNLAENTLTLGTGVNNPGTLSHPGTAAGGWINGANFIRYFNTNTIADRNVAGLFPLGSSTDFRPLYISFPAAALTSGGTINVAHTASNTAVNVNIADGSNTIIRRNNSYWTITPGGGLAVSGTPFNISVEGTGFGTVTKVNDLRLTLTGSVVGTAGTNGGTTLNPQINRTGLSLQNLANNWYPGSISLSSPLPIELINFDAVCDGNKAKLNWSTASETNNDYFTIFKSRDASTWNEISNIAGAGNSNETKSYSFTDNNYDGSVTYYKLKQTDYNGHSTEFNATSVDCSKADVPAVSIYPNPFTSQTTISLEDASSTNIYEFSLYNILGAEVMHTVISNHITPIETSMFPAGFYSYTVTGSGRILQSGKLVSQN